MSAAPLPDAPAHLLSSVPEGYAIRSLDASDVEALVDLDVRLFHTDAWPESMFRDELAHPEWRRYWGVCATDAPADIVGYLGLQYSPRIADIQTIGVLAGHRRKGLAGFLMRLAAERAAAWGAESMMLEVRVDNTGAIGLYEGHGFRIIHTRPGYYADGTDALIMMRDVADRPEHPNRPDRAEEHDTTVQSPTDQKDTEA
ncbi:MAG: GNAT family N-acetyltransferase [Galactobacter sp.]